MIRSLLVTAAVLLAQFAYAEEPAIRASLEPISHGVANLVIDGAFLSCGHGRDSSLIGFELKHPSRSFLQDEQDGALELFFNVPGAGNCHIIFDKQMTFKVRIDTSQAEPGITMLRPHFGTEYEIAVNHQRVGVLTVGLVGDLEFQKVPRTFW